MTQENSIDACLAMDLYTCDRFMEEDCIYTGDVLLKQVPICRITNKNILGTAIPNLCPLKNRKAFRMQNIAKNCVISFKVQVASTGCFSSTEREENMSVSCSSRTKGTAPLKVSIIFILVIGNNRSSH